MTSVDFSIKNKCNYQYPFKYRVIYIFQILNQGDKYDGCFKIGMSSIASHLDGTPFTEEELKISAEKRIK